MKCCDHECTESKGCEIERVAGLTDGERRFVRFLMACAIACLFIAVLTDRAA